MRIKEFANTLNGNYYVSVQIDDKLSVSADTNYLEELTAKGDKRMDAYITSISMRVWKEKDVFVKIKASTFSGISNI